MKTLKKNILLSVVVILSMSFSACEIVEVDVVQDPNRPTSQSVLNDATPGQIQDLLTGLENKNRDIIDLRSGAYSLMGVFGRELYYFNSSDPNFITAWIQLPGSVNAEDNSSFFVDASMYEEPYQAVQLANLTLGAVANTNQLTEEAKSAASGFAKTIKAFQLLIPLHGQYQNGIRTEIPFEDPFQPGPFRSYDEALSDIRAILDDGAADLGAAGSTFPFVLTDGFDGFETPADLLEWNRAIAARVAIYAEDWGAAITATDESFMQLTEGESSMNLGVYHTFNGGNDILNPYFFTPTADENDLLVVHPSMLDDAETNDQRVANKFFQRAEAATNPDFTGPAIAYQHATFASATDDFPMIRNEELILIRAEALAQRNQGTDLTNAVDAINIVRNSWGLGNFISLDQDAIIDQVLFERRYSLWGEGHRWVDARRYDRLNQIPTNVDGGRIPTQIARPQGEIDWDEFTGN
ncbi:RagB/SusD family nutrient uptake outer membrane protein [Fodinibius salsisoli]|uniref:RagB/SusD family nutrient uptake outer membrane protein n=1 Tax=Fodinibius salsisoli TaxID=2820877 RepID=A0ABT3PP69_9BACT|nr:RagB/SusD family nutrient uptake outer membrane protein [Fodinibius salsisoli]MCW9707654.1 RagB/SusD family nutrient uptake outer membrane protein [Fodinibius salsisoli]